MWPNAAATGSYNKAHALGCPAGNSALLDDNLVALGNLGNVSGGALHVSQVGGISGTHSLGLGRRVDGDKYEVGLDDGAVDVGREEQVLSAAGPNDLLESGLVDRKLVRVPRSYSGLIEIDDRDLDVWVLACDHSTGRAAWEIPGQRAISGVAFGPPDIPTYPAPMQQILSTFL